MTDLPTPLSALRAAARKAGSVAAFAEIAGLNDRDAQRLYRAHRGDTQNIGADLYRAALSFLTRDADAPTDDEGARSEGARPGYDEWKAVNPELADTPADETDGCFLVVETMDGEPWWGYPPEGTARVFRQVRSRARFTEPLSSTPAG